MSPHHGDPFSSKPKTPSGRAKPPAWSLFWLVFRKKLPLERETSWFILVSVLDIFLTYLLLRGGGHVEANPMAFFFIASWGMKGMVFFKMAMVAFITVLAQLIALKNKQLARRVLFFGIAAVSIVLVYSATLLARTLH